MKSHKIIQACRRLFAAFVLSCLLMGGAAIISSETDQTLVAAPIESAEYVGVEITYNANFEWLPLGNFWSG